MKLYIFENFRDKNSIDWWEISVPSILAQSMYFCWTDLTWVFIYFYVSFVSSKNFYINSICYQFHFFIATTFPTYHFQSWVLYFDSFHNEFSCKWFFPGSISRWHISEKVLLFLFFFLWLHWVFLVMCGFLL